MKYNNSDSNEFFYLFDGLSMDSWRMAGPVEFVLVEYDKSLRSEGGNGITMVCRKEVQGFCTKD
jgi:hypothetical protein